MVFFSSDKLTTDSDAHSAHSLHRGLLAEIRRPQGQWLTGLGRTSFRRTHRIPGRDDLGLSNDATTSGPMGPGGAETGFSGGAGNSGEVSVQPVGESPAKRVVLERP